MFDPRSVANAILSAAERRGIAITNLQLQKLLYLAHGVMLRNEGVPLVTENFEAWDYGPVSRSAYHAFKLAGDGPIRFRAKRINPRTREELPLPDDLGSVANDVVDGVVEQFGTWPAGELVELTHSAGSPWTVTIEQSRSKLNIGMIISNDLIQSNFEIDIGQEDSAAA